MAILLANRDTYDSIMMKISENKDLERGLKHVSQMDSSQCDPVLCEMAETVLEEVNEARKKRKMENKIGLAAFAFAFIFCFVLIMVKFNEGKM